MLHELVHEMFPSIISHQWDNTQTSVMGVLNAIGGDNNDHIGQEEEEDSDSQTRIQCRVQELPTRVE